ncbi:COG3650 family protein [Litchfieldella anticariensis]|nr:MliC family protein [Halomonas anticariensis]
MSSSVVSVSRFLPALLGAGLILAGCASSPSPSTGNGAGPEVRERPSAQLPSKEERGDEQDVVKEIAPLMPSVFFTGGAEQLVSWRCTPAQDLISSHDGELRLWSTHGAYQLESAVVASGARYVKDDLSFWNKGDEAQVESENGRLDCQKDMTRQALTREDRPGVMFHGRGNEPGWVVNLAHDAPVLTLLLDYGNRELTLPYRVVAMDNQQGRVVLESGRADQPFRLSLEARACFDSMSGAPYPVRVTLDIDEQRYQGCGQGIAP